MVKVKQDDLKGQRFLRLRLALIFLLISFLVLGSVRSDAESEFSPFPAFSLPGFSDPGAPYDNALFRERDFTVVNFFASWCGPCRIEHPILMELAGKDVAIIGVNYMDDLDNAKEYLGAEGNPYFLVLVDIDGALDIPLQINGIPKTVVVDREGNTVLRIDGRLREPYLSGDLLPLVLSGATATIGPTGPSSRSDIMEWNTGLVLAIISIGGILVFLFRTRKAVVRNGTGSRHRMSKPQAGAMAVLAIVGFGGAYLLASDDAPSGTVSEPSLDEIAAQLNALNGGESEAWAPAADDGPETMSMEAAISRLTQRLQENPEDVEGWVLLARSHMSVGNGEAALATFEEAVRQVPDNVELVLYYGEALMAASGEGRLSDKNKQVFARAVELAPEHPGARYYQALIPYLDGDVELARTHWLEMVRNAPADAPWLPTVQSMLDRTAADLGNEASSQP